MPTDNNAVFNIGVTGTIGSGKSAVGRILESLGVPVIDTDKVVHQLLDHDQQVQDLIAERFGKTILISTADDAQPRVDRKALGVWVFKDFEARKDLEAIIHPRVRRECRRLFEEYACKDNVKAVATLVPLLFESSNQPVYDAVWTVIAEESVLRERLKDRDHLSSDEITNRLAAQFSQEKKASLSARVIDNSTDLEHTRRQVESCLKELLERKVAPAPGS